jgi:hypothetical protein
MGAYSIATPPAARIDGGPRRRRHVVRVVRRDVAKFVTQATFAPFFLQCISRPNPRSPVLA